MKDVYLRHIDMSDINFEFVFIRVHIHDNQMDNCSFILTYIPGWEALFSICHVYAVNKISMNTSRTVHAVDLSLLQM